MAYFCSTFDAEDIEALQAAETTIKSDSKAQEAFDDMFEESTEALEKLFDETWRKDHE